MPSSTFFIKVGDLLPVIQATLLDGNQAPVDLTTASAVTFSMESSAGAIKINKAAASFANKAQGIVQYAWILADTNTADTFSGEFEVTFPAGNETFPNDTDMSIYVTEEVAP